MQIRQVTIENFRGLRRIQFCPGPRTLILGPNNAGKSSVLDALDLLLHPGIGRPRPSPTEVDYFNRDPRSGFSIEAVIGQLSARFSADTHEHLEGWRSSERLVCPDTDGEGIEAVVRVRVRATADFDLVHEFAKPESAGSRFGPALRAQLGWIYDGRTREPFRELAFYQGGVLERFFGGIDLEPAVAKLGAALRDGAASINAEPGIESALGRLAADLRAQGLVRSTQQIDFEAGAVSRRELLQTLRLALSQDGVRIPVHRQGRGAQRLLLLAVLLHIARAGGEAVIGGFEEPEEALEPVRQRQVAEMLLQVADQSGQIIVVSHSTEITRRFAIDDVLLLSEGGHGEDAKELSVVLSRPNRQAYERHLDGSVTRGLFCAAPILVEGPSDRAVLETFWSHLAKSGKIASQSEVGVDVVNCEGCTHMPAIASLLAQAGKAVVVWAEQDHEQVIRDMDRIEAGKTFRVLVKAAGIGGRLNLEGALVAKSSLKAIAEAMKTLAEDRGYQWSEQRKDLLSRLQGTSDVRRRANESSSIRDLFETLAPSDARRLAADALSANRPTPFEIKGGRQGRVFAEAIVKAEGVPSNFEAALCGVRAGLKEGDGPSRLLTLECTPRDDGSSG